MRVRLNSFRRLVARLGFWSLLLSLAASLLGTRGARAQTSATPPRKAELNWDSEQRYLYGSTNFHDAIDAETRSKLSRGLPITIVLSALVYVLGQKEPVASTVQSCRSTWHVWQEMYRVELTRPNAGGATSRAWTPTVSGVLRRCAEAQRLLLATDAQIRPHSAVWLNATVHVNPISPEVLQKIRQWITHPLRPPTGNPGGALFSTFTRLFLANIGEADRVIQFTTEPLRPGLETVPRN